MTLFSKRLLGASLALALLWTCGVPGAVAAQEPEADPYRMEVIARVDGIPITRGQLLNAVNNLIPARAYHTASLPERRYEKLQTEALDNIILSALMYKEAEKLYKVAPADIDAKIEEIKGRVPKGDTLEIALKRSNMTMEDLRGDIKKNIVVQKRYADRLKAFEKQASETVTEAILKDYYEKNLAKFMIPENIRLRNILIKADPAGGQRIWNVARKRAIALVERARAGEDFAELARQNSEEPKAAEGGDMGWADKSSLMEEVYFTVSAMKKGDTSDPIRTIYGYNVIKLEDVKPAILLTFTEIDKPQLEKKLVEKESTRLMDEWKNGLRNKAKIEHLKSLY